MRGQCTASHGGSATPPPHRSPVPIPDDNDSVDCDNLNDGVIDSIKARPNDHYVLIRATIGDLRGTLPKEG